MKISVITVVYNGERFLESCLRSVAEQDYPHLEHIVVDGGSKDGTLDIIRKYEGGIAKWISEKDKGIYDAINKGIRMATGEVVGVLNADDFFANKGVLSRIAREFSEKGTDTVFAELVYVNQENENKVVRYYSPKKFRTHHFLMGDMPPHPTFYARRELFLKYGLFKDDYRICADFELMLRFLYLKKVSFSFIPEVLVKMRMGGVSTRGIQSTLLVNREMLRACRENGLSTSLVRIYSKYFSKVWQLISRPAK